MTSPLPSEEVVAHLRSGQLDELVGVLHHLYLKLAKAYVDGGGELNPYIIEEYLPGLIFETAKLCEWIPNYVYRMSNTLSPRAVYVPEEGGWADPDSGSIGKWCVNKAFETEFFRLLDPAISALRKIAESNARAVWQSPTPADLVQQFLDDQSWLKNRLIKKVSEKIPHCADPEQAAKKQLKVIVTEPVAPNALKDYHIVLCGVMRENSKLFASLEPLDLVWRYRTKTVSLP